MLGRGSNPCQSFWHQTDTIDLALDFKWLLPEDCPKNYELTCCPDNFVLHLYTRERESSTSIKKKSPRLGSLSSPQNSDHKADAEESGPLNGRFENYKQRLPNPAWKVFLRKQKWKQKRLPVYDVHKGRGLKMWLSHYQLPSPLADEVGTTISIRSGSDIHRSSSVSHQLYLTCVIEMHYGKNTWVSRMLTPCRPSFYLTTVFKEFHQTLPWILALSAQPNSYWPMDESIKIVAYWLAFRSSIFFSILRPIANWLLLANISKHKFSKILLFRAYWKVGKSRENYEQRLKTLRESSAFQVTVSRVLNQIWPIG